MTDRPPAARAWPRAVARYRGVPRVHASPPGAVLCLRHPDSGTDPGVGPFAQRAILRQCSPASDRHACWLATVVRGPHPQPAASASSGRSGDIVRAGRRRSARASRDTRAQVARAVIEHVCSQCARLRACPRSAARPAATGCRGDRRADRGPPARPVRSPRPAAPAGCAQVQIVGRSAIAGTVPAPAASGRCAASEKLNASIVRMRRREARTRGASRPATVHARAPQVNASAGPRFDRCRPRGPRARTRIPPRPCA